MRLLLIKHGEDLDDIEDKFGGWHDIGLTEKGKEEARIKIPMIQDLQIEFELIISSTFKRTQETAEILSQELNIRIFLTPYLIEHNVFGILSGMNREIAKTEYPELIRSLENNELLPGAETREDFDKRVTKGLIDLELFGKDNVIVVTHGGILRRSLELAGKTADKPKDHSRVFILLELKEGKFHYIKSNGIEIK